MYNVSIAGGRVTILPTIKLSHAVSPQVARQINNPNDVQHFQWQILATAALDPLDFSGLLIEICQKLFVRYISLIPTFTPILIFRYGGAVQIRGSSI